MTSIVIATELDRRDWVELCVYISQRSAAVGSKVRERVVSVLMIAALAGLSVVTLRLTGQRLGAVAAGIGAVIGIVGFIFLQRFHAKRVLRADNSVFLGPVRYELDEHGMRWIRAGMSSSVDWNRVEQIDETPTAIYLALDRMSAYVIPKRAVDAALLTELVAQLRSWHAERTRTSLSEPVPAFAALQSEAITREVTRGVPARRGGFFRDLLGNLRAGLNLMRFRKVPLTELTVSFDQLVPLLAIVLGLLAGLDWLLAEPDAVFDSYGLDSWVYYLLAGLCACALIARAQGAQMNTRALLVAWLAAVPGFIVLLAAVLLLPLGRKGLPLVLTGATIVLLSLSERVVRTVFGSMRLVTLLLIVLAIVGVPWVFQTRLYLDPHLWAAPSDEDDVAASVRDHANVESLLFDQANRIAAAVNATAPQRPGTVDKYFLGFAGYGSQSVFRNETLFGERVIAERLGTAGRAIDLINDEDDRDSYPLATVSGLRYALRLLGERMDRTEDMLVLFLTSHGSRDRGLAIENRYLPLPDLGPDDLRGALDDSGIRWRIVIVSACYAGVFLEPLKSPDTLVITAADATHNSFGCADDRGLTYFGEAFLRDALPGSRSLEAAFQQARSLIAAREKAEKLTPSNPQMFVGTAIRQKLATPSGD